MTTEKLDWELKIDDLMSGPLAVMERRLSSLDKALGKLGKSDFDKALGKSAKSAEQKVSEALGAAKTKLTGARADFAQAWTALLATPAGSKLLSPIVDSLAAMRTKIGGVFSSMGATVRPVFARIGGFFAPLVSRGQALWDRMTSGVRGFGTRAMTVLGPLGSGFSKLFGVVGSLGTAISAKLGPAFSGLGKAAGAIAPAVGGAVVGALAGIAAIGGVATTLTVAAGKWAIGGLSFKEDTLVAFKTMLGTEDAAQRVFKKATTFAASTPFSTEEVVSGFQRFLVAGFKENELDKLMNAVGDVGANMGTEKMEQVSTALGQIKAKGKLQGEEMMQLAEAGVGQSAILDALQKNLNINKATAQARISGGQITGQQGIDAILEAIRVTQSGGTLGGAMEGKSKTLSGMWSSIMDIPSTLLFSAKTGNALEPLKAAMQGVLDAFKEGSPLFDKASAAIGRISDAWGKAFGAMSKDGAEGVFSKLIDGIESFMTKAAPFAEGFFPELMNQVSMVFDALAGDSSAGNMKKAGEDLARSLGLLAGMMVMAGQAVAWVADKFSGLVYGIAGLIDPSVKAALEGNGAPSLPPSGGVLSEEDTLSLIQQMNQGVLPGAGGTGDVVAGNVTNHNTAQIGDIIVQVAPGEESAGRQVAAQLRNDGGLISALTNFATEMGG